jgi:hypothetical protein
MSLGFNRRRIFVKGLGNVEVREVYPSTGTAFQSLGFLEQATILIEPEEVDVMTDIGARANVLTQSRRITFTANLLQTAKDEISFVTGNETKEYEVRYFGLAGPGVYQWFLFRRCRITPQLGLDFKPGQRLLPVQVNVLEPEDSQGSDEMYIQEVGGLLYPSGLELWADPAMVKDLDTVTVRDVSGFDRDATLSPSGDVTSIWNDSGSPVFFRFDGSNDYASWGDILDDDDSGDFVVEAWVRVQAANGTEEAILSKKSVLTDDTAGFVLYRTTGNNAAFKLSSGSASAEAVSTGGSITQNVWKHVAVSVDRNGNAQMYVNGVASGSPVSFDAIGTGANAVALYLGRCGTNYGQVDVGSVRVFRYTTGNLPSDVATRIASHFDAERDAYGI